MSSGVFLTLITDKYFYFNLQTDWLICSVCRILRIRVDQVRRSTIFIKGTRGEQKDGVLRFFFYSYVNKCWVISNLKTQLIQTLTGLITDFTHLSSLLITETNLLVCVVPGSVWWWWCCSVHLGWRIGAVEFLSVDTADKHDMGWTQESWSWVKINYHLLVGSLKSLVP